MPDESRVKPQPLQPEAKPFTEAEFAERRKESASSGIALRYFFAGPEDADRLLATTEEARREQVRVTDEMVIAGAVAVNAVKSASGKWSEVFARKISRAVLEAALLAAAPKEGEE